MYCVLGTGCINSNPHDSTVCVALSRTNYVPDAFQQKLIRIETMKRQRAQRCFAQLDERSANEAEADSPESRTKRQYRQFDSAAEEEREIESGWGADNR